MYRALDLLDFLATKTPTKVDDEFLALLRGVLLTPAGAQLLDYLADALHEALNSLPAPAPEPPPVPKA